MKNTIENEVANNNNENLENIMNNAEVNVEIKERKNFSTMLLEKIDKKFSSLPSEKYENIRESISALLVKLEDELKVSKEKSKMEKTTFKKLEKFSKEAIEQYLSKINK